MHPERLTLAAVLMIAGPGIMTARADYPAKGASDVLNLAPPGTVQLRGWIGDRLDACLQRRVWDLDPERYVSFFRTLNDKDNWRGEYWGKWYTAAALAYAYRPSDEHLARMKATVRSMIDAQHPDGYLGTYQDQDHLTSWDVWCRKYVLLGLLTAYDLTGEKAALEAARRQADNLIDELSRKKIRIVEVATEVLQGTADSSIIEPMALLYQRTGERRYLDLARSVVDEWKVPFRRAPQGIPLIENALAGKPPLNNHAYAIMSCFEGLCELYRATGDPAWLDAAVRFGHSVRVHERMIDGSVSNQERFFQGARGQTEILEQPQETCATVTWIKLCCQLLRLTGDPVWADEMEVSLYNAMAAAMTPGGEWFAYYIPLTGERVPSFVPHGDLNMSCCVASGPRGLLLTPRWAVMSAGDGPAVNLYAPGTSTTTLADGTPVKIVQETDYPVGDRVVLTVDPGGRKRFTLRLRIPGWSRRTGLSVNGQAIRCEAGTYAKLDREWAPGDQVALTLDLRGRAVPAPSGAPQLAVMRGPILLALDNRLVKSADLAVRLRVDDDGYVPLKPSASTPRWAWMAFDVLFDVRPSHFFHHYTVDLAMCDFASAGNEWAPTNLYRAWLPQPLFLSQAFVANTWKLMFGEHRPAIPPAVQASRPAVPPSEN